MVNSLPAFAQLRLDQMRRQRDGLSAWRSPARAARGFSGSTGGTSDGGVAVTNRLNAYNSGPFLARRLGRRPFISELPAVRRASQAQASWRIFSSRRFEKLDYPIEK